LLETLLDLEFQLGQQIPDVEGQTPELGTSLDSQFHGKRLRCSRGRSSVSFR
jgi:hypothetical protein